MDKTIDGNGIKRLLKNISTKINEALNDSVFGAFNMRSTSSFNWDNNKVGKPKAGTYYKISEVVPTIEQLERGGNVTFIGLEGTEVIPFTSNDLDTSKEGAIAIGWPFVIISDAGTIWDGYTFSETGIYFYSSEDGYVSALKITSQASEGLFNEFLLKIGCLPKHAHSWSDLADALCGEYYTETGASIVKGDGIDHAGFTKVSDKVVELSAITRGGTLKYTQGTVNKTIDFPGGDYALTSSNDGVLLTADGLALVAFAFVDNPVFGSIRLNTVTEKGIHFLQDGTNYPTALIVNELTLNGYSGFPGKVIKKLDKKYLPDDIGNTSIDFNDTELIEAMSSDTLEWDGDTTGHEVIATYVHVSSATPTLEDFANGWSAVRVDYADGVVVSEEVVELADGVIGNNEGTFFVSEADGVVYEGFTLSKGVYFLNDPTWSTTYSLTIPGYQFVSAKLALDYLPEHKHTWRDIAETKQPTGGSFIESNDIVYDDFHKVSNVTPAAADFNNGYTVKYYDSNKVLKELISGVSPLVVTATNDGVLISNDGLVMVAIAFVDNPVFGAITINSVKSPGLYFKQASIACVHSLDITGYTGFPLTVIEKVPDEYLPFSGTILEQLGLTVSNTLIWDGDTTDLLPAEGVTDIYRLSSCTPTIEDFEKGWSLVAGDGEVIANTQISEYQGMLVPSGGEFMVVPTDGLNASGVVYPKKGIYVFDGTDGMTTIRSLTIEGYNNFISGKIRKEFLELS